LSKAYNHVDLSYFCLTLNRIKVPKLATELIINLFTSRKNAVFTT
ncbi:1049_t:CDS:1, partial [Funneliformis mosseae]